jgi:cell wall-associated NlpC family hydrolase
MIDPSSWRTDPAPPAKGLLTRQTRKGPKFVIAPGWEAAVGVGASSGPPGGAGWFLQESELVPPPPLVPREPGTPPRIPETNTQSSSQPAFEELKPLNAGTGSPTVVELDSDASNGPSDEARPKSPSDREPQPAPSGDLANRLSSVFQSVAGLPYSFGSAGGRSDFSDKPAAFDCSGFVSWLFNRATGGQVQLPAFTDAIAQSPNVEQVDNPQPGDLVLYRFHDPGQPGVTYPHVAVYAGDGKIWQAGGLAGAGVNQGSVDEFPGATFFRVKGVGGPQGATSESQGAAGDYRQIAAAAAQKYGLDPAIFSRQIETESGFNPAAVSPAGAIGIAQFMPGTAKGLGIDPTDPVASLDAAAKLMSEYVQRYGNVASALAAYNAGPAGNWNNPETRAYISRILGVGGDVGTGQALAHGWNLDSVGAGQEDDGNPFAALGNTFRGWGQAIQSTPQQVGNVLGGWGNVLRNVPQQIGNVLGGWGNIDQIPSALASAFPQTTQLGQEVVQGWTAPTDELKLQAVRQASQTSFPEAVTQDVSNLVRQGVSQLLGGTSYEQTPVARNPVTDVVAKTVTDPMTYLQGGMGRLEAAGKGGTAILSGLGKEYGPSLAQGTVNRLGGLKDVGLAKASQAIRKALHPSPEIPPLPAGTRLTVRPNETMTVEDVVKASQETAAEPEREAKRSGRLINSQGKPVGAPTADYAFQDYAAEVSRSVHDDLAKLPAMAGGEDVELVSGAFQKLIDAVNAIAKPIDRGLLAEQGLGALSRLEEAGLEAVGGAGHLMRQAIKRGSFSSEDLRNIANVIEGLPPSRPLEPEMERIVNTYRVWADTLWSVATRMGSQIDYLEHYLTRVIVPTKKDVEKAVEKGAQGTRLPRNVISDFTRWKLAREPNSPPSLYEVEDWLKQTGHKDWKVITDLPTIMEAHGLGIFRSAVKADTRKFLDELTVEQWVNGVPVPQPATYAVNQWANAVTADGRSYVAMEIGRVGGPPEIPKPRPKRSRAKGKRFRPEEVERESIAHHWQVLVHPDVAPSLKAYLESRDLGLVPRWWASPNRAIVAAKMLSPFVHGGTLAYRLAAQNPLGAVMGGIAGFQAGANLPAESREGRVRNKVLGTLVGMATGGATGPYVYFTRQGIRGGLALPHLVEAIALKRDPARLAQEIADSGLRFSHNRRLLDAIRRELAPIDRSPLKVAGQIAGQPLRPLGWGVDRLHEFLFEGIGETAQLTSYLMNLKRFNGDKVAAATLANEKFASIPLEDINNIARTVTRAALFAANWQMSLLREAGAVVGKVPLGARGVGSRHFGLTAEQNAKVLAAHRADLAKALALFVGSLEMMNYALSGHWTWQNEPGHVLDLDIGLRDKDGQPVYWRDPAFRWASDIFRYASTPASVIPRVMGTPRRKTLEGYTGTTTLATAQNKLAPLVNVTVGLLEGKQWPGGPDIILPESTPFETLEEVLTYALNQVSPVQIAYDKPTKSPAGQKLKKRGPLQWKLPGGEFPTASSPYALIGGQEYHGPRFVASTLQEREQQKKEWDISQMNISPGVQRLFTESGVSIAPAEASYQGLTLKPGQAERMNRQIGAILDRTIRADAPQLEKMDERERAAALNKRLKEVKNAVFWREFSTPEARQEAIAQIETGDDPAAASRFKKDMLSHDLAQLPKYMTRDGRPLLSKREEQVADILLAQYEGRRYVPAGIRALRTAREYGRAIRAMEIMQSPYMEDYYRFSKVGDPQWERFMSGEVQRYRDITDPHEAMQRDAWIQVYRALPNNDELKRKLRPAVTRWLRQANPAWKLQLNRYDPITQEDIEAGLAGLEPQQSAA